MKVNELFEAYTPPVKNKKLSYGGQNKIPMGGTKEWLKAFGATETDIEQALRVVRQSQEYRDVLKLGMTDESTERHTKLGSIMFVGFHNEPTTTPPQQGKFKSHRWKLTVQANGKIDETAENEHHRYPMTSAKPRIVPGDAVQSIVKSMQGSLVKMAKNLENRRKQEKKIMDAVSKAK